MKWIETVISTTSAGVLHIEIELIKCGISGWEVIDMAEMHDFLLNNPLHWDYLDENLFKDKPEYVTIKFYLEDNDFVGSSLETIKRHLFDMKQTLPDIDFGPLSVTVQTVDDNDWIDAWKEFFKPIEIGSKIVVKPAWEEYSSEDRIVVSIDPGTAFGTGQHATTRMCIEALEDCIRQGDMVLDLGCGSGILSIISLLLGADSCSAVDINPDSAAIVHDNMKLNGISDDRLSVYLGDILSDMRIQKEISARKYDCIVANIVTDVVLSLLPLIKDMGILKRDGFLICSGIIKDRLDEVIHATEQVGYLNTRTTILGEWACFIVEQSESRAVS